MNPLLSNIKSDNTFRELSDFSVEPFEANGAKLIPKIDLDFGNVVQLRLLFFNFLKLGIYQIRIDLMNVQFIDEITLDVLMEIAKKMDIITPHWSITFVHASPDIVELIQETPLTYVFENVNIK